jgi:hypothetical protein
MNTLCITHLSLFTRTVACVYPEMPSDWSPAGIVVSGIAETTDAHLYSRFLGHDPFLTIIAITA